MAREIASLWPTDIRTDALAPVAVLRQQAGQLRQQTKGLLDAEVRMEELEKGRVAHRFVIIASALDGGEFVLFIASHALELVYPVRIQFKPWTDAAAAKLRAEKNVSVLLGDRVGRLIAAENEGSLGGDKIASDETELLSLLKEMFTAAYTRSILTSLIAKSNAIGLSEPTQPV